MTTTAVIPVALNCVIGCVSAIGMELDYWFSEPEIEPFILLEIGLEFFGEDVA